MTRGGVTPPIPPGTTAAQVFADAACTTRPTAGAEYRYLYIRVNRDFGFDDSKIWDVLSGDGGKLEIRTPTTDMPDDQYRVLAYIDWVSPPLNGPITAGTVVRCEEPDGPAAPSPIAVDFYDE